ncbi:hypothetical protein BJ875DRAFT_511130 [Amylocarpus encephaloides]|uniref:RING-type domain-containing protein n=1 Tax=Amylocarpus encephaloides TaxID=45428 RepID=A0A9P7YRX5_9HELO|nr:hypothetical protein BJ875DRAFT_511130 [Amylocarpus encephaloides]
MCFKHSVIAACGHFYYLITRCRGNPPTRARETIQLYSSKIQPHAFCNVDMDFIAHPANCYHCTFNPSSYCHPNHLVAQLPPEPALTDALSLAAPIVARAESMIGDLKTALMNPELGLASAARGRTYSAYGLDREDFESLTEIYKAIDISLRHYLTIRWKRNPWAKYLSLPEGRYRITGETFSEEMVREQWTLLGKLLIINLVIRKEDPRHRLLRQAFTNVPRHQHKGEECVVCQVAFGATSTNDDGEEIPAEKAIQLPCRHILGSRCAFLWMVEEESKTCPMCRKNCAKYWLPKKVEDVGKKDS